MEKDINKLLKEYNVETTVRIVPNNVETVNEITPKMKEEIKYLTRIIPPLIYGEVEGVLERFTKEKQRSMSIEQAIKKAIDAGWNKLNNWHNNPQTVVFYEGGIIGTRLGAHQDGISEGDAFLDPLFWQSLGEAMGWGRLHCTNCGEFAKPVREKKEDPEYWHDCCGRKRRLEYGKGWEGKWHDFIDSLIQGKKAEDFFKDL